MSTNILTEEQWHEKYLQTLENYRPIDDDFFTKLFQDNIPLAEKILRIITDVKDLHLTSIKTQETLKKLAGSRSVRFDAFGHDNLNREFDIEVQRADSGASPKRARYHSSSIDTNYLKAGQDFDVLPTTYVIFITENDIFVKNELIYRFDRMDKKLGLSFDDEAHIIYVNGAYNNPNDTSELAKLVHDFRCSNADEMYTQLLAERTRYFKETPEGVSEMCKAMEEMQKTARAEGEAIGMQKGVIETLIALVKKGLLTISQAAAQANMTVPEFEALTGLKA
ncbi:MAG: PD-(D/E)XK nuclease family transposase [Methanosphaera sp.]|nr:PD-(D/E)XK nuclease family transposase [Methanosphaera sp.]